MLTKNLGTYFFVNLLVGRSERNYPTRFLRTQKQTFYSAAKGAQTITRERRLQPQKACGPLEGRERNEKLTRVPSFTDAREL